MSDATENIQKAELATHRAIAEILRKFEPAPAISPELAYELAEARLRETMKPAILAR